MTNKIAEVGRNFARQQIIFIVNVVLTISLIIYFFWGLLAAKSALVAGAVVIIPNIVFAYKAFKYAGAQASRKVVDSFFSGVKFKMALMALLLALAFKFLVLVPLAFFSMFCLVLFLPVITARLFKN